ncbi:MAG TPA: hypothetical protein DCR17_11550 [Verrucomicrobiales bacterium]|nr:hypothetical protein [Pedosphaera sp.]HAO67308.1 hypothetical protein [Verrucomicrobiales bacterium]HAW00349.1 hypothetical protein [Verrucomicrobiales bacterium]HBP57090.1 hypothetical protein [Verrucomicrobiales bacterium]HCP39016.1 hypothetical protein [Verrucomicrobiales bacterium]
MPARINRDDVYLCVFIICGASECSVVSLISHALLMFLNLGKCVFKAKGVMKLKASFPLPFRFLFLYSNSFSVFFSRY